MLHKRLSIDTVFFYLTQFLSEFQAGTLKTLSYWPLSARERYLISFFNNENIFIGIPFIESGPK